MWAGHTITLIYDEQGGAEMRILGFVIIIVMLYPAAGLAAEGMISIKSNHDVKTTADRLEKVLKEKGMTLFARIDHASGAREAGSLLNFLYSATLRSAHPSCNVSLR